MGFFNPDDAVDYPAYVVSFTSSGDDYSIPGTSWSLVVANSGTNVETIGAGNSPLGLIEDFDTGLIAAIVDYITTTGWDGAVSNLTVKKFVEANTDVTPS